MTLKDLSVLAWWYTKLERPSVPEHAIPKTTYSDATANGLASCIVDFCKFINYFDGVPIAALRTGNEGRYRPGEVVTDVIGRQRQMKGTWLPGQNNGMSDTTITMFGRVCYVEIKIGRDRMSEAQEKFAAKVRQGGGQYDVVKSWDDFYKLYEKYINLFGK